MNSLLGNAQTSGNEWVSVSAGRLYHPFQESAEAAPLRKQLADFADLEEQMMRFEADFQALILEVRRYYVTPAESIIEEIFRHYRTLPQVLLEAVPHLRRHFGDTIFALRPSSDEYGWQILYADAIWPGEARDAVAAIDAFDDAWWIANSRAASNSLAFTYRLV